MKKSLRQKKGKKILFFVIGELREGRESGVKEEDVGNAEEGKERWKDKRSFQDKTQIVEEGRSKVVFMRGTGGREDEEEAEGASEKREEESCCKSCWADEKQSKK